MLFFPSLIKTCNIIAQALVISFLAPNHMVNMGCFFLTKSKLRTKVSFLLWGSIRSLHNESSHKVPKAKKGFFMLKDKPCIVHSCSSIVCTTTSLIVLCTYYLVTPNSFSLLSSFHFSLTTSTHHFFNSTLNYCVQILLLMRHFPSSRL